MSKKYATQSINFDTEYHRLNVGLRVVDFSSFVESVFNPLLAISPCHVEDFFQVMVFAVFLRVSSAFYHTNRSIHIVRMIINNFYDDSSTTKSKNMTFHISRNNY